MVVELFNAGNVGLGEILVFGDYPNFAAWMERVSPLPDNHRDSQGHTLFFQVDDPRLARPSLMSATANRPSET